MTSQQEIERAHRPDAKRALKKAAAIASGDVRGMSVDEWLVVCDELAGEGIGVEFTPEDAIRSARLWAGNDGYVIEDYPVTPDAWDEDALTRTEARALLEGGLSFKPVVISRA